jgi:hypothetical protein
MALHISQVVAETGDLLIGLAPKLGLTCKSFYKYRVLKSLGATPCCLKNVTRPADGWSRVTISNVAVHVPALSESADRLSTIRWTIDFLELRAFMEGRRQWPTALKDVEVIIKSPDIAAGIEYVKGLAPAPDFSPDAFHVCVESNDAGSRSMVALTAIKAQTFAEVFGDCIDLCSMLRACLSKAAKEACEKAWACVHLGRGEYQTFDVFEGFELEPDHWSNDPYHDNWNDDP